MDVRDECDSRRRCDDSCAEPEEKSRENARRFEDACDGNKYTAKSILCFACFVFAIICSRLLGAAVAKLKP